MTDHDHNIDIDKESMSHAQPELIFRSNGSNDTSSSQWIQYGDILQIFANAQKPELHEKTFLVDYIDDDKIRIVNTGTFETILLYFNDDGQLMEPSIQRIDLLTRAKEPGVARQKKLLPDTWIDIYFLGVTQPITGKITHLEEDQIEVTLHPSQETIYLDFSYRGIPEEFGIEKFVLRSSPPTQQSSIPDIEKVEDDVSRAVEEEESPQASVEYTPENESIIHLPKEVVYDTDYRKQLEDAYLEANEILFGKDQEVIEQYVETTSYEKVFSLQVQLDSLMNELVSHIPNARRTHDVMDGIHLLLERFKELRETFSTMDLETQQVVGYRLHGPGYKPLLESLTMPGGGVPLSWLLPVTQTRHKMYVMTSDTENAGEMDDVVVQTMDVDAMAQIQAGTSMGGSVNPYTWMLNELDPHLRPTSDLPLPPIGNDLVPRASVLFQPYVTNDCWESVVENAAAGTQDPLTATAAFSVKDDTTFKPTKLFFQKFTRGTPFLERSKENRRQFVPTFLTAADKMAIQSWITFPASVGAFSRTYLPTLDMMRRTSNSQHHWLKFRTLMSSPDVFVIDNFDTNHFQAPQNMNYMTGIQHYVLDPALARENASMPQDRYESYVNAMVPCTFELIELVQPTFTPYQGLCVQDFLEAMEPHLVYRDSLTYTQFNRIRYFIGKRIQEYRKAFYEKKDQYRRLEDTYLQMNKMIGYDATSAERNLVKQILEKGSLYAIFADTYQIQGNRIQGGVPDAHGISTAETVQSIYRQDYGALFSILVRDAMLANVIPESMIQAALESYEDQGDVEKIRAKSSKTDCQRRFLTKRYTSLEALQKDDHHDDVFYDKEFDTTPYHLLDAYKKDMPLLAQQAELESQPMQDFLELLAQNLIKRHACPPEQAEELAETLVIKKKRVNDGEYAILELSTATPSGGSVGGEKEDYPDRYFYKRMKQTWVKDPEAREEYFADMAYLTQAAFPNKKMNHNRMLCQASPGCVKNQQTDTCDPFESAENQLNTMRQTYALEEMKQRLEISQKELEKEMSDLIVDYSHRLAAKKRLVEVLMKKNDFYAYHLGKLYVEGQHAAPTASPYIKLRDDILGQENFPKKQYDLVRLVNSGYVRRPMIEEMSEDPHWLYCTQTNTKLLPAFLYDLATEYTTKGEEGYQAKLEKMKAFQMMSDDGDAIVDKHSGYVISKIEWVREELYDEHGFKIKNDAVLEIEAEEDEEGVLSGDGVDAFDAFTSQNLNTLNPLAENENQRMVKNIFFTFCRVLDLSAKEYETSGLKDTVMRISLELMDQTLLSKEDFAKQYAKKMDPAQIPVQYKKYYHQYVLIITTAMFLVGMQTAIPEIPTKKTVPGCVKSFSGYPLDLSTEDQSGIQYMTCILNLVKSSVAPWNTIQNIKRELILQKIREKIVEIVDMRKDVYELYAKKREHRLAHPEDYVIPASHHMDRWLTRLPPPLVDMDVAIRLPRERPEWVPLASPQDNRVRLASKIIHLGYGVIESIHRVVEEKDAILKTTLGIPFVQNACCNEHSQGFDTLAYFVQERPVIQSFLEQIRYYEERLNHYNVYAKAATMVNMEPTRPPSWTMVQGNLEEIVYSAFIHYGNFDRIDADIPEYLRAICPAKPAEEKYRRRGTLIEKIQDLKQLGKHYHLSDFENLIRRVNMENRVTPALNVMPPNAVRVLTDFLANNVAVSPVIDPLRAPLLQVLVKYDPQVMLLERTDEPGEMHRALNALKNTLAPLNDAMRLRIVEFLRRYGKLSLSEQERAKHTLEHIAKWSLDAPPTEDGKTTSATVSVPTPPSYLGEQVYEVAQFIKNSVVFMVKVLPEKIRNRQFSKEIKIPKHWHFAPSHEKILGQLLQNYYVKDAKFTESDMPKFLELLQDVQGKLIDAVLLVQMVPVQMPIRRGHQTWFRLLDTDTLTLLMEYIWYSVLDQYIKGCNAVFTGKASASASAADPLKKMVASLIAAFLKTVQGDKAQIDQSYTAIMKKVNLAKDREKQKIMAGFENASKKDRRFMFLEKMWKHGRWNVNIQNGLVNYDKKRFEQEILEMNLRIDAGEPDDGPDLVYEDPLDIAEDDANYEENNIDRLDEDYMNGYDYDDDDGAFRSGEDADDFGNDD